MRLLVYIKHTYAAGRERSRVPQEVYSVPPAERRMWVYTYLGLSGGTVGPSCSDRVRRFIISSFTSSLYLIQALERHI